MECHKKIEICNELRVCVSQKEWFTFSIYALAKMKKYDLC